MIMLHAIRPYEADGDVRHGLAFRTDDGAEHVGYIEDGAVDGAPAMLKFCSCDHSAAEVLSRSSRDATLEFAYKGKRVSVAYTASLLDGAANPVGHAKNARPPRFMDAVESRSKTVASAPSLEV